MKKLITLHIGCVLLLLSACKKENFTILNLNGNWITALGHSGLGVDRIYPGDTYESVLSCLALGADGSEINMQLTKDNVLVGFHDSEMDATTNLSGLVSSHTWAELKNAYFDQHPYIQYELLRFDNFFTRLGNEHDYIFAFDCKLNPEGDRQVYYENFTNAIIALVEEYGLKDRVIIESTDPEFLLLIQRQHPGYTLYLSGGAIAGSIRTAAQHGFKGIITDWEDVTAEDVKAAHDLGIFISFFRVHTRQDHIDAIRKNPDMIQSDDVECLLDLLQ